MVETIADLGRRGIGFTSITENIDSGSAGGRLVFHLMAALAEFERALRGFQRCSELDPEDRAIHLLHERANWQARSGSKTQDWTGAFDVNLLLQDPTGQKKNS